MKFFLTVLITSFAVIIGSYIMPGVVVDGFITALVVAFVLGLLNALLKPILIILTLPVTILTLGLFLLVINAFLIQLSAFLVRGFEVSNFGVAFLFSIVLTLITWLLNLPAKASRRNY
jgi:putative membrane protein